MFTMSSLVMTLQFQLVEYSNANIIRLFKHNLIWKFFPHHLKWDDDSKLFEIMILYMLILWAFTLNSVIFESGNRVTNQFDQFNLELNQCEWNKFPIELQRLYLISLLDTQRPKTIHIGGGIACTRETCKRVNIF